MSETVGKLRSIIASMKNGIELGDPIETLELCESEIRRLRAENAGLKPLAKLGLTAVVECAWQGCDFDGDVIQEGAEKFGAIVEAPEGYDPDLHGDSEFCDPGDRWYTFTPAVEAVRDALNEEMGS